MQLRKFENLQENKTPLVDSNRELITLYIAKLDEDTWYCAGLAGLRVLIDSTLDIDELPNQKDLESEPFAPSEIEESFCELISDLFASTNDEYDVEIVVVGIDEKYIHPLCEYVLSKSDMKGRLSLRIKRIIDDTLVNLINLTVDKESYFHNVKNYRKTDKASIFRYGTLACLISAFAYMGYDTFFAKQPQTDIDDIFARAKSAALNTSSTTEKKKVDKKSQSELVNEAKSLLSRLQEDEALWFESYIRHSGHNNVRSIANAISSLYGERKSYALEEVLYVNLNTLNHESTPAKLVARYKRANDSATLSEFIGLFDDANPTLDGLEVIVTGALPAPRLEKSFSINEHFLHPIDLISSMQSYKRSNLIDGWTLNKTQFADEALRPIPLTQKEAQQLQDAFGKEIQRSKLVSQTDVYALTVKSSYLESLDIIDEIVKFYPSAVVTKVTYTFPTSSLTSEIHVYDFNN